MSHLSQKPMQILDVTTLPGELIQVKAVPIQENNNINCLALSNWALYMLNGSFPVE